jgi:hypothetical protein
MNFTSIQKSKPTKISKYFEVTPNGGSSSSSFNTLNLQLNTTFDPETHFTSYELFIQNYEKLNITGQTTTAAATEEKGDMMVLQEVLKYLIYHPFLSRKINKYDVTIHTTSKHLANANFNTDTTTTTIRSMLSCIHSVSINLQ